MIHHFNPPTQLQGNDQERLRQLHSYLHRMSEQLNVALRSLNADNFADQGVRSLVVNAGGVSTVQRADNDYNELKSLIATTASIVEAAAEEKYLELESSYSAVSDAFGAFAEDLNNRISLGADGLFQDFNYHAMITGANEYILNSNQYIKAGLLFYDDLGMPQFGFAVGDKLSTMEIDGEVVVLKEGLAATFTSDELAFWQNEEKVAWVSNNQLCINEIYLNNNMNISDKWLITHDHGYTIKWIGG